MQTFLPYPDFAHSAAVLDVRRLGKQRIEAMQVLRALTVPGYGWQHHPAVAMWRGHAEALADYALTVCDAWTTRGYGDTCAGKILQDLAIAPGVEVSVRRRAARGQRPVGVRLPAWLGRPEVHASHRSMLLRKDPLWYGRFGWSDALDHYVWPVRPYTPTDASSPVLDAAG